MKDQTGDLGCLELGGEEIAPGETREVKLILTKAMTTNNVGLTSNTAEIYESYNALALSDLAKANDQSSAEVIIAIRTGNPVMYISIVIGCMLILGGGIYMINKKVLATEGRAA